MTCVEVHAAIRAGRTTDDTMREHGTRCPSCAELLADDGALGRLLARGEEGEAATGVMDRVLVDRTVSRMPTPMRRWIVAVLLTFPAFAVAAAAPRPDLAAYPAVRMVLVLAVLAGAGVLVASVVLRPLHRAEVGAGSLRVAFALGVPVLVGALPQAVTGHPASTPDVGLAQAAIGCFVTGSVFAAGAFVAIVLTERRRRIPLGWVAGSVALAAVGGALALQITCPVTAPAHLVWGHGVVGLGWTTVALAVHGLWVRRSAGPA